MRLGMAAVLVVVLRAGRAGPCAARVGKEVEACPPRRSGGICSDAVRHGAAKPHQRPVRQRIVERGANGRFRPSRVSRSLDDATGMSA